MKHIVVVEDDPGILEPMTIMLQNAGYQVTCFFDGSAILTDDFDLPDMFILDKQLPGIDGLDLCRHLKNQEQTKNIPIILLSCKVGYQDAG
ncbi:response regulator [Parapedobacter koreensis]|uniref:Two-component system, OmpR family, phosphate regulon response regulator PhoB n=1 Tax=Parapedobacter koreensis TaxID=332977 RepID=A0A1H7PHI5_9SPHI|nr:response regulator [Parapedobacter koreensis]SEL35251.1 two-component system, OmpR family, phosphate regulon response regulator PhoB [Parapedobacter koreensis]